MHEIIQYPRMPLFEHHQTDENVKIILRHYHTGTGASMYNVQTCSSIWIMPRLNICNIHGHRRNLLLHKLEYISCIYKHFHNFEYPLQNLIQLNQPLTAIYASIGLSCIPPIRVCQSKCNSNIAGTKN